MSFYFYASAQLVSAAFGEENINGDTEMASKRMLKRSVTCLIVSASSL